MIVARTSTSIFKYLLLSGGNMKKYQKSFHKNTSHHEKEVLPKWHLFLRYVTTTSTIIINNISFSHVVFKSIY